MPIINILYYSLHKINAIYYACINFNTHFKKYLMFLPSLANNVNTRTTIISRNALTNNDSGLQHI